MTPFDRRLIQVSILVAGCGLTVASDGVRLARSPVRPIGIADVNRALVEILRGPRPESAVHSCWGTVIGYHDAECLVLTAAHCVVPAQQQSPTSIYVKLQDKPISWPSRTFSHPRFNSKHRSANFDVAVITVALRDACGQAVPIAPTLSPLRPGKAVTALNGRHNATAAWNEIPLAEVTATSLTFAANAPLCMGSSGAPILLSGSDGYALVGVVSSGPNDCTHDISAARTSSALRGFLNNILDERPPREVLRTCGECIEQAWEGDAPCVTSIDACRHDANCAEAFACIADPQQKNCPIAKRVSEQSSALLVRAHRCICRVACNDECDHSCRAP